MQEPKEIRDAFDVANRLSWTQEELDVYDYMGMHIQDERGRVEHAREEGKKIGVEEGKIIGIAEGKKIGVEEGERSKAVSVARELLSNGISIDIIIKSTGLTKEDIDAL